MSAPISKELNRPDDPLGPHLESHMIGTLAVAMDVLGTDRFYEAWEQVFTTVKPPLELLMTDN